MKPHDSQNGQQNGPTPPVVMWAQRADQVLLTIDISDCKEPTIKLDKDKLYFKGKSNSIQSDHDHNEHEVTLEFYKPIKVDESKHSVKARGIEFVIEKEESGWWPRLMKGTTKSHWLKIDFPKWKDEDDSEDEMGAGGMPGGFGGGNADFGDLMKQFGGMSGAGGLGDMGGDDDDGEEVESDDDDTETPPELEE